MQTRGVNVLGSANVDLVVQTPRFPMIGETVLGGVFSVYMGGKGANQAVAAGRLGGEPGFIGQVGDDDHGRQVRQSLVESGVDVSNLAVDRNLATGVALITVAESGQNTIVVASGANMSLDQGFVARCVEEHPSRVLLAQLEIPLDAIGVAKRSHHGVFILNPAPAQVLPDSLLAGTHVLTPNEVEAEQLTGIAPTSPSDLERCGRVFLDKGVEAVVFTLGAAGSARMSAAGVRYFPAPQVPVVDTTAAGDAFSGALAHFLSVDLELDEAVSRATSYAALSVTRPGAQAAMPSEAEFERFMSSGSGA